jgi:hypothetical protein
MKYLAALMLLLIGAMAPSCKKIPQACFEVIPNAGGDTLHVNETIKFDASCSENGAGYDWNFSDDTSFTGKIINRQFADTGDVLVRLVVTKGGNTDGYQQYVHIYP